MGRDRKQREVGIEGGKRCFGDPPGMNKNDQGKEGGQETGGEGGDKSKGKKEHHKVTFHRLFGP